MYRTDNFVSIINRYMYLTKCMELITVDIHIYSYLTECIELIA